MRAPGRLESPTRNRRAYKRLPSLLLLGLVAIESIGCIGLAAVVHGAEESIVEAPIATSVRGRVPLDTAHARRMYGDPNSILPTGPGRERWRYRTGLRFHGVSVLLIVLPVPLIVHTGMHYRDLEFEDGRVVRIEETRSSRIARIGCLYGPLLSITSEQGCFAERTGERSAARLVDESGRLWSAPGSPSER